jgi:solute carrier family 8 (sodium/calcium exchanger)
MEGAEDELADVETKRAQLAASTICFDPPYYWVPENIGTMDIVVKRFGDTSTEASVHYKTRDGTAEAGSDYDAVEGDLIFAAGDTHKTINVNIIDDELFELDENFLIELSNLRCSANSSDKYHGEKLPDTCLAPKASICHVTIIDDDDPGELCFDAGDDMEVTEDMEEKVCPITIKRTCGLRGDVTCRYKTEDGSAIGGKDYVPTEGILTFKDNQTRGTIEVTICPKGRYQSSETFRLVLYDAEGGIRFCEKADGGPTIAILTVTITPETSVQKKTDSVVNLLAKKWDKQSIGNSNYKDQFRNAVLVNGGDEGDAGVADWVMHIIGLPWKLLFALIPPTDYCDGWLCFNVSLAFIGFVTVFIGDLAGLLGCTMGVPDQVTAITFVALGTSLPDTFASKTAAQQDEFADASIGNVTGSNSVNVFLGLGLPWTFGALAWTTREQTELWLSRYPSVAKDYPGEGGKFVVIGGSLGFSVGVFTGCALVCVAILCLRRRFVGGELGGPTFSKYGSAFAMICLWITYISMSSWKALSMVSPCGNR